MFFYDFVNFFRLDGYAMLSEYRLIFIFKFVSLFLLWGCSSVGLEIKNQFSELIFDDRRRLVNLQASDSDVCKCYKSSDRSAVSECNELTSQKRLVARPLLLFLLWGCSSVGRANGSQSLGREFDPPQLHHIL